MYLLVTAKSCCLLLIENYDSQGQKIKQKYTYVYGYTFRKPVINQNA